MKEDRETETTELIILHFLSPYLIVNKVKYEQ